MRPGTQESYQERVQRVLAYIDQNLDAELDLADLARVAHFSPFHFHRVFRGMVGEPVKEHVRRRRMERAAGRLRSTARPVVEIAFDAGYETPESFTRAFEGRFRMPPSVYRKRVQEVVLRRLDTRRIAALRHVGPYDQVGEAWRRLMAWAGPLRMFSMLGVVIDDPEAAPGAALRYDAAVILTRDVTPPEPIRIDELAGGEYAVMLHPGPYTELGASYAALCGGWLP